MSPRHISGGQDRCCYTPFQPRTRHECSASPIKANEFDWDLDVEDTTAVKLMIHYFYHHDYPSEEPEYTRRSPRGTSEFAARGLLVTYSKMYAMAEKYQVPGLKLWLQENSARTSSAQRLADSALLSSSYSWAHLRETRGCARRSLTPLFRSMASQGIQ
jgi:hypothetical protein